MDTEKKMVIKTGTENEKEKNRKTEIETGRNIERKGWREGDHRKGERKNGPYTNISFR
jgi:hypothetical protein